MSHKCMLIVLKVIDLVTLSAYIAYSNTCASKSLGMTDQWLRKQSISYELQFQDQGDRECC